MAARGFPIQGASVICALSVGAVNLVSTSVPNINGDYLLLTVGSETKKPHFVPLESRPVTKGEILKFNFPTTLPIYISANLTVNTYGKIFKPFSLEPIATVTLF